MIIFLIRYMCACLCIGMWTWVWVHLETRGETNLELELQAVVSHSTWVMITEFESSARALNLCCLSSPLYISVCIFFFYMKVNSYFVYYCHVCVCVCLWRHTHATVHVWQSRQLCGIGSAVRPLQGFQESNSRHQTYTTSLFTPWSF